MDLLDHGRLDDREVVVEPLLAAVVFGRELHVEDRGAHRPVVEDGAGADKFEETTHDWMDSGKVSDTWSAIDCSRRHLLNGWLSSQVHFWIVLSYCIVQVGAVRKCGRRQFEMRDKYPFGYDERLLGGCLYCGAATDTTEHIPSKVFLDKPYPANLHTMKSCGSCNNGFSIDEEYVSCFIDAVICGSTGDLEILRPKVGETFIRKPEVANRIEASRRTDGDETFWNPEIPRFIRIIEKIARGHASHDLGLRDLGTESG